MEPMRKCVSCMQRRPKWELLRIVRRTDGTFHLDESGKQMGRGAYVCDHADCIRTAIAKRQLNRSFRQDVGRLPYAELEEKLDG